MIFCEVFLLWDVVQVLVCLCRRSITELSISGLHLKLLQLSLTQGRPTCGCRLLNVLPLIKHVVSAVVMMVVMMMVVVMMVVVMVIAVARIKYVRT